MQLTILGNNGPFPGAGGACSGYLLTQGDTKILIDCGNGVLSNLQKFTKFEELDAIILTHLHSDHMSDMMVLRYAIQIKMNRGQLAAPLSVYAPPEPTVEYERLNINNVFRIISINKDLTLRFGNLSICFCEMRHPVQCFAVSVQNESKKFVFSGDTAWTENIISFGKDADVLMLDAGLLSKDKTTQDVPHLTAKECGIVARESKAKRLFLTHFWPEYDTKDLLKEARENFDRVEAVEMLKTYDI